MRVGFGSDLHRLVKGRPLLIGGIRIESEAGEEAHSDGDVLLHALIDAILGATASSDIGTLFPSEDRKYKDADSKELLREVLRLTNVRLINIDSTVSLEEPKLKPYIKEIRGSIAELCSLDINNISVKAKTHEGLGIIGEKRAIMAEVVILIE